MTERGIPFSAPMVRAIREGRKTQTRRVMREQRFGRAFHMGGDHWQLLACSGYVQPERNPDSVPFVRCPYGMVGDLLYVRETFFRLPPEHRPDDRHTHYIYKADWTGGAKDVKWKSGRFMPKVAARLWFKILDVRVQRVQEITRDDALAEGVDLSAELFPRINSQDKALARFPKLWDSLNADRGYSFKSNPWVWALTFERTERPAHEPR